MLQPIPDPVLIVKTSPAQTTDPPPAKDLRESRIDEFLMARSLSKNSQKAYRQDLKTFTDWTDVPWAMVSPRLVAQFKDYLEQETGKKKRSAATVRRILGTLKNFLDWMARSRYLEFDPSTEVQLPKLPEPEAGNLSPAQIEQILAAVNETTLPERNLAMMMLLLHGLRASEVCKLNVEDYLDHTRIRIKQSKADSKGFVPLNQAGRTAIQGYLEWRKGLGHTLEVEAPMFVSHSRQNAGARLTYGAIRKTIDKLSAITGIDFHSHQGRHSFATSYLLKGMNPHHIMTIMRQKSTQNFRRYSKAAEQAAAEEEFYKFEQ